MKNYLDKGANKVLGKVLEYVVGKTPEPSHGSHDRHKAVHVGDFFIKEEGNSHAKEVNIYYRSHK